MEYLINRLKEVSTWQGIIAITAGLGFTVSPELGAAIAGAGAAIFGLVSVVVKERGSKDA